MIRVADETDVDAIVDLESGGFSSRERWSAQTWLQEVSSPTRICLVYCDAEHRVKGVGLFQVIDSVADLHRIIVARECRCEGVATQILDQGITELSRCGASRLLLEVDPDNEPAVNLYEKTGFVLLSTRKNYYPGGRDAHVMELVLAESETADPASHLGGDR